MRKHTELEIKIRELDEQFERRSNALWGNIREIEAYINKLKAKDIKPKYKKGDEVIINSTSSPEKIIGTIVLLKQMDDGTWVYSVSHPYGPELYEAHECYIVKL